MKKSLIALAVLAASGAAMAQSSVTLYGIADLWVGSVKSETAGVSTRTTSMVGGGVDTSRWGMKGSEDLGGGLKANFNFEQGFNIDDGGAVAAGAASADFTRQAWVGLSGGFGEVKFGKTGTAFDNVQGRSDAVFDSDLAPANNPGGGVFRTSAAGVKANNSIHYQAPTMGGFSGAFSYSLNEKVVGAVAYQAFNLTYAGGPVAAQLAYQKNAIDNVVNDESFTRLGASYNFGVATAKVMYGQVDNTNQTANGKTTEWQLGADFPVSPALTLSASYATSKDNAASAAAGVGEVQRKGFGAAAAYSLSKRTTVYGGFKVAENNNGTAADTDITVFAVGVNHKF